MFIYLRAVVELRAAKARAKPSVLITNWRPEKSTSFKPLKFQFWMRSISTTEFSPSVFLWVDSPVNSSVLHTCIVSLGHWTTLSVTVRLYVRISRLLFGSYHSSEHLLTFFNYQYLRIWPKIMGKKGQFLPHYRGDHARADYD